MSRPSRPEQEPARRRPDASMTLLTEVMHHPLDPGYALAAARRSQRRAHGGDRRRPRSVRFAVTALVALLCGLVVSAAVAQLRRPAPEALAARRALEREVQRRTDQVEQTRAANEALRERIVLLRARTLTGAGASTLADQVASLGRATGELAVAGPGLEVTLRQASTDQPQGADGGNQPSDLRGRVLDRDLQIVVNGLWAAGAEAVAVNDLRLTSLSAIRAAGQAILVDLQPLVPPYSIEAVGDPARLRPAFRSGMAGQYLDLLSRDGIRSEVADRTRMTLPGSVGGVGLTYARPVGASAGPTPTEAGT